MTEDVTVSKLLAGHYEEDNDDEDDDYVQEEKPKKSSSRKRVITDDDVDDAGKGSGAGSSSDDSSSSSSDDDDYDDNAGQQLKPKSKRIQKQTQQQPSSSPKQEDADNDPSSSAVYEEDNREAPKKMSEFDTVQLALKRTKKKEELTPAQRDEMCREILTMLDKAFISDMDSREAKRPAVAKLLALDKVLPLLHNKRLASALVDMGVGESIVNWLRPTRRHLPNVRIRTELIRLCDTLPFAQNEDSLRASKLGKMLNFYANHDQEVFENRTLAGRIVKRWMDQLRNASRQD